MIYHYRNSNIIIKSIINIPNENADLENICKELEHTKVSLFKTKDNLQTLRKGLDSLSQIIEKKKEIIVKLADKGSILVIMSQDYYWNICQSHVSDTSYYRMLNDTDPSNIVQQPVTQFADKYKLMLTLKEDNYLTKRKHKISNLYMLLKLHKSKRIYEYVNT